MNQSNGKAIKTRVLLVGCPRSGTTLLQRMLAENEEISSVPETHFCYNIAHNDYSYRMLRLVRPISIAKLNEWLGELDLPLFPGRFLCTQRGLRARFCRALDAVAQREGASIWVEKTPMHLHYIPVLEKIADNVKFLHLLRNGEDVVASLYKVTNRHPDRWGGARNLVRCCERWVNDVAISLNYQSAEDHHLVSYERLIEEPEEVIRSICSFIGVPYSERMLQLTAETSDKLVKGFESWKRGGQQIGRKAERKFDRELSPEEREEVRQRIAPTLRRLESAGFL